MACHKVKDKQELIRLVRVSDGSVEVDTSGKKAGRGAYLCRVEECWSMSCEPVLPKTTVSSLMHTGEASLKELCSGNIRYPG